MENALSHAMPASRAESMFLSREQIDVLTGCKRKATQVAWLKTNKVKHWVNAAGWPVVPRSAIDAAPPGARQAQPAWEPKVLRAAG